MNIKDVSLHAYDQEMRSDGTITPCRLKVETEDGRRAWVFLTFNGNGNPTVSIEQDQTDFHKGPVGSFKVARKTMRLRFFAPVKA